jgi:hypothetical protein
MRREKASAQGLIDHELQAPGESAERLRFFLQFFAAARKAAILFFRNRAFDLTLGAALLDDLQLDSACIASVDFPFFHFMTGGHMNSS